MGEVLNSTRGECAPLALLWQAISEGFKRVIGWQRRESSAGNCYANADPPKWAAVAEKTNTSRLKAFTVFNAWHNCERSLAKADALEAVSPASTK